jgi:hypothetical protein
MTRKAKRYDGEDGSLVEDESDRGTMTPEQQANSDATNAGVKPAAPAKPKIVTKEQLAASGYDNLRDYLNATNPGGPLKRRDGSAPSKTSATPTSNQPSSYAEMAKNIPEGTSEAARQALMANVVKEKQKSDSDTKKASSESSRGSMMSKRFDSDISGSDLKIQPSDSLKKAKEKAEQTRTELPSGKRIREMLGSKYAKGGSVSSASKRADGIAQKGHTKGRVC